MLNRVIRAWETGLYFWYSFLPLKFNKMKKILFLCDGDNFSESAFAFIRSVNAYERVFVKGLFFNVMDFEPMIHASYVPTAGPYVSLLEEQAKKVKQSIDRFEERCLAAGIQYHVRNTKEEWRKSLFREESRFADLVVASEDMFGSNVYFSQPGLYLHEALHESECPVMLVPELFRLPESIVVAYDGKKECMFALKQFNYLFPQYSHLPVEMVYVTDDGEEEEVPNQSLASEYSSRYYPSQRIFRLSMNAGGFAEWLEEHENVLLVAGSFSRPVFSGLWHKSFANRPINRHIPVFVAHR